MKKWIKKYISPEEFHLDVSKLAELISQDKYEYVYGPPRGGHIIGAYLSHYLDLTYIESYDTLKSIQREGVRDKVLIADDLVDTGVTMEKFKEYNIAVLYYKPRSIVRPTYYVKEIPNDLWVCFPWEKDDEKPNRDV